MGDKKALDWNTPGVKAPFYSFPLTNSGNELINELQCNSEVPRTFLIHRLMKIPTNSSSNNRRTIKSSPLNRTPHFPLCLWIRCAIKASSTEETKQPNLISCHESTGKKSSRTTPRSVLRYAWWRRKIASVSKVSLTTIHTECFSFFKR